MSVQIQQNETIDHVVTRMEDVLERCNRMRSRLGYFAALYLDVTCAVRKAIRAGEFDDGPRMERLDVVFANRYLTALDQYWRGAAPSKCWLVAFQSADLYRPIILQHLLLGMNAHINLDLAIAAAQIAPGADYVSLRNDFRKITELLRERIADVQGRIGRVSPWYYVIDRVGGRTDDRIAGFAVAEAREVAWVAGERLARAAAEEFKLHVALHDEVVTRMGMGIRSPGGRIGAALQLVRLRETRSVPHVIGALRA